VENIDDMEPEDRTNDDESINMGIVKRTKYTDRNTLKSIEGK